MKVWIVKDGFVITAFQNIEQAKIYADYLNGKKSGTSKPLDLYELYVFKSADELIKREEVNLK